jgi:DnaJ like chaperone protein
MGPVRPPAARHGWENDRSMPWQTILKTLGAADGGTLSGLGQALRSALGMSQRPAVERAAFTAAVVALAAKLSKSDGVSLRIEAETFERLFHFDQDELENVRWLFDLAAKDTAGFEAYAREVARALAGQPDLERDVFEALMLVATADGVLHPGEDRYLHEVATILGYSETKFRAIRARYFRDAADPYEVLGVSRDIGDDVLKRRYRELVRRHHPDVLAGKGHSHELQDVAARNLAAINAAWDEIAKERGL